MSGSKTEPLSFVDRRAVAFLVSEPAGYLTSVALQVDGGLVRSVT